MYKYFEAQSFDIDDIDNFGEANFRIFEKQEAYYKVKNGYHLLSLLSVVLIDLGLIEIHT